MRSTLGKLVLQRRNLARLRRDLRLQRADNVGAHSASFARRARRGGGGEQEWHVGVLA